MLMNITIKRKLEKFFSKYKFIKYKKREILIRGDDPPTGIFYLKEGVVREYVISKNGDDLTLNIYKPYALFPMSYAINNSIPTHYFEAMTEVLVFRAAKEDVLQFVKKEPGILLDLLSRIYRGLEGLFLRMEHLMINDAQARLLAELVIYTKRFGKQKNDGIMVDLKLTQKDLAAQTGMARETVGRLMKILRNKGLFNIKNKILIVKNLDKLEKTLLT